MTRATPAEELVAMIAALRAKGELRRQIVRVEAWDGGRRVHVPHLLIDGQLVPLTPDQIAALKSEDTP